MGINLDSNAVNNGIQTMKNLTQVAANLTKEHKPQQEKPKQENTNQPHTQTVEVKVGEQTPASKPIIVKEKPETHVHKYFPDNRELSDRECGVREMELKQEHEYKMRELDHRIMLDAQARQDRKEREERAEKDRERRRERDRRAMRNICIGVGAVCVVAAGVAAYNLYTDSRGTGGRRLFIPASHKVTPIQAEGEVK